MSAAALLKRVERLKAAMGQSRLCVLSGPYGGDAAAAVAAAISSGRARPNDLFVYVNRYSDDWAT
jgi:hypothetical protein